MKRSIFLGTVSAVFLLFCAGCGDTAASSAVSSMPVSSEVSSASEPASSAPVSSESEPVSSETSSAPVYYTAGYPGPNRITEVYDDSGKIIGATLPDGRYFSEEEWPDLPWENDTGTMRMGRKAVLPDGTTIIDPFYTEPAPPPDWYVEEMEKAAGSAVSSEAED